MTFITLLKAGLALGVPWVSGTSIKQKWCRWPLKRSFASWYGHCQDSFSSVMQLSIVNVLQRLLCPRSEGDMASPQGMSQNCCCWKPWKWGSGWNGHLLLWNNLTSSDWYTFMKLTVSNKTNSLANSPQLSINPAISRELLRAFYAYV